MYKTLMTMLLLFSINAFAGKAHHHGEGQMDITMEGKKLVIKFLFAGHDVFGFETVNETEKQKKKVKEVRESFEDFKTIIDMGDNCDPKKFKTRLEASEEKSSKANKRKAHASLEVRYEYECDKSPGEIKVLLFKKFPSVEKIEARWLLPNDQGQLDLDSKNNSLLLN